MQIVCIKYQSLFSRKYKKNITLSSAEFVQRVMKVILLSDKQAKKNNNKKMLKI